MRMNIREMVWKPLRTQISEYRLRIFHHELTKRHISKVFWSMTLHWQPDEHRLPVLLKSCQSGERLSIYNGSCGLDILHRLSWKPNTPTSSRAAGGKRVKVFTRTLETEEDE